MRAVLRRGTTFDLRGCHGWDASRVIRTHLLALVACHVLAACNSGLADEVVTHHPIADPAVRPARASSYRSRRSFPWA